MFAHPAGGPARTLAVRLPNPNSGDFQDDTTVFIYHFHRIIRHRVVWGLFAVIVSLAFLSVDSCFRSNTNVNSVAQVAGKPVPETTFTTYEREIRGLGRNRKNNTPLPEIATQVWRQVAALQVADELKLGAAREEIRAAVQESLGATEGYDSNIHATYLAELKRLGLQPADYEQYLGRILTLRKVESVVEAASWTTPVEVDDELAGLTDSMTIRAITVTNRFANIKATEAQIRAFFDAHTNSFRLPKQVAVQYVALPVSNYLAHVAVSEEQLKEYYDDHGDKLTRSNTTDLLTFAEARPQILPLLQHQLARQMAFTNLANSFLEIAAKGGNTGFAAAATAFSLSVHHTPFFALDEPVAGIDAGKEFRDAAFELDPSQPEGRYSVVQGENFVYAITPLPNSPSPAHMPTLEEVIDRVRPFAADKVRADAFHDYLETLHKDLAKAARENHNPIAVAQSKALNVSTSITFSVHMLYQNTFTNYMPVARAALHLQPGELSEASQTEDENTALFVFMVSRQPGDTLSAEMLRPKARANLERARSMGLNATWMDWNLTRKGLVLSPRMIEQLKHQTEAASTED